ncbi:MAG TPA: STAS domain-containing protein, partial [Deltaproteobacteria bacterium]|nr:STAS domain-containing protein [Deltaproteobacteria bacterium]
DGGRRACYPVLYGLAAGGPTVEKTSVCRMSVQEGRIVVEGTLDRNARQACEAASAQVPPGTTLFLDCSGIEHVDIFGLNELVRLRERARAGGGAVRAVGVPPELMNVFRATGTVDAFDPRPANGPTSYDSTRAQAWAAAVDRIRVDRVPEGAVNLNVDGRRPVGATQGFGRLWEKTYLMRLPSGRVSPQDAMAVLRRRFPSLQPPENRFFPGEEGIVPGGIVLINARTPGGLIATGVWVVYADEDSFAFMTPRGHPESGWVAFTAYGDGESTVVRITGFARAGDPLYELAFEIVGSRVQERIWTYVLRSLASGFGLEADVGIRKSCVGSDLQWARAGSILYNAQVMTFLWNLKRLVKRS